MKSALAVFFFLRCSGANPWGGFVDPMQIDNLWRWAKTSELGCLSLPTPFFLNPPPPRNWVVFRFPFKASQQAYLKTGTHPRSVTDLLPSRLYFACGFGKERVLAHAALFEGQADLAHLLLWQASEKGGQGGNIFFCEAEGKVPFGGFIISGL